MLTKRSISEETVRLQAEYYRLQLEVAQFPREMDTFRAQLEKFQNNPPSRISVPRNTIEDDWEDKSRTMILQVGAMMNTRFEALENRLFPEKRHRLPLAAD